MISADALARLTSLIAEAEYWVHTHRRAGRKIEALAAAIRLQALQDALAAITKG